MIDRPDDTARFLHPAVEEVLRFHGFLERWLGGSVSSGLAGGIAAALEDPFEMVLPDGQRLDGRRLVQDLRLDRGSKPGIRIEIRHARVLDADERQAVVRYEEWQRGLASANQRISTACFRASARAPLGWSWLTVHESWISTA